MSTNKESLSTAHDETIKHYSAVTKLVHYTSKFGLNDDARHPKHHPLSRHHQRLSTLDLADRSIETKKFRLAPLWPEWNETDINSESWDAVINAKKKDTGGGRTRSDTKTNVQMGVQVFEDPDGKIELPPSLRVDQWRRPIDFLPPDRLPVIVDPDLGIQNFDLVTPNEHLHYNEIMRNIISQITALWDICRKERKHNNIALENILTERTWRPWEHIYAMSKVSKQPFITPYNPAGKYVVRLFFLGTWRKVIIDDSIPFDAKDRCLLPQTTLPYELWPMLLSKALLKIISLDFNSSNNLLEYNETTVIHSLTGWIPESIPLKYTHAEKVWNFLRYDRSNKVVHENENGKTKTEQNLKSSFGPVPLFKWPDAKVDSPEEVILANINDQSDRPDDNMTKKSDDKSSKKGGVSANLPVPKDPTAIKSTNTKENRAAASSNPNTGRETKRTGRGGTISEDPGAIIDDQIIPQAPKIIVFGTIPHLQPTRLSSYSETADRSERLRRYNLNDTFSTSTLLTSIRDIPLEAPLSPEQVPAWKLIRPKKAKVLPHAEPVAPQEPKADRWIEMTSPYINYPTATALNIKPTIRPHSIDSNATNVHTPIHSATSRLNRSATPSMIFDALNIIEVDDDGDIENNKPKLELNPELVRPSTILSLPALKKEFNVVDTQVKPDDSVRSAGSKMKRQVSVDKTRTPRKSAVKVPSDTVSIKSKAGENEQTATSTDKQGIRNNIEQQNSLKTAYKTPKIWMDFDDFCACFTSIVVFHNPRGYQYSQKHTELKYTPYQPPVVTPALKERRRDANQPVVQQIPNLQDDKSPLYIFVDSTRQTLDKNIEIIVSLTCLSRWYDATLYETVVSNEKSVRGSSLSTEKAPMDITPRRMTTSQKEITPQAGSLIAEIYSWKSLSIGQPVLRLHTTATKAALLTLTPGRHVLKLTNTCPLAFHIQVLSDTSVFIFADEDQLLTKISSVPEDAEFIVRAEELFLALDESVQNFHLIDQKENKLHQLFRSYCEYASKSNHLTVQTCLNTFNQALYITLRAVFNASGAAVNTDTQFAWRCFTNDLTTPDILAVYETARKTRSSSAGRQSVRSGTFSTTTMASTSNKKSGGGRDKSSDDRASSKQQQQSLLAHTSPIQEIQDEPTFDWLTREVTQNEIDAVTNIQKSARGFLQRRVAVARAGGTEKNLLIQRALQATMAIFKVDLIKSALLLFKNLINTTPQLIQCFQFRDDDWNMITYRDYNGIYQEQSANTWFVLFREIFYINEESFLIAKFLSHVPNSLLRVINNDTYDEMALVFNRLAPGMFTKNKHGYTFFAEGRSLDQSIATGRFRLRLLTSYTHLPEARVDQITSSFLTKEIMDYYLPNTQQIICRYHVIVADDINQTGRNFHLASIQFSTSKSDVLIRLTVLDNNEEIVCLEGKGNIVLPAILFMRNVTSIIQRQPSPKPPSKSGGGGARKKESGNTNRGSSGEINSGRLDKDRIGSGKRSRSNSRRGTITIDEEEKFHKYIIQVTLLRQSWPLTATQWHFVEQHKEQEKNELKVFNRPPSPIKLDERPSGSENTKRTPSISVSAPPATGKGRGTGRTSATASSRPSTAKTNLEKIIDISKPHWILRVVSDADKAEELTIRKDTERNDELMNTKKAWETLEAGRAQKAMQARQKFLDSVQPKVEECVLSNTTPGTINRPESHADQEIASPITPPVIEQQQQVVKQTLTTKKGSSSTKRGSSKDEASKRAESIPFFTPPQPQIDEPLLDEPPPAKSKTTFPSLDIKPFLQQKLPSDESITFDPVFEQEDLQRRQNKFTEYAKYVDEIRRYREADYHNRYKEKIRQLEEYVDLQAKNDQTRRAVNEPREAFRQRFLEVERKRLEELAIKEQKLIDEDKAKAAAKNSLVKKKTSAGKKKKK